MAPSQEALLIGSLARSVTGENDGNQYVMQPSSGLYTIRQAAYADSSKSHGPDRKVSPTKVPPNISIIMSTAAAMLRIADCNSLSASLEAASNCHRDTTLLAR